MRTMKTNVAIVGALIGLMALSGCGTNAAKAGPSPSNGVAPTGTPVVIEPLKSIEGAKRFTTDLFGIDVPAGMTASTRTLDNGHGTTVLSLTEAGAARAAVNVTVTAEKGATDELVAVNSADAELRLRQGGLFTNLQRSPATWQGMDYAVALTGTMNLKSDSGTLSKDTILVTTRDPGHTSIVVVSAEAAVGGLRTSQAYAALRTLRFGG